MGNNHAVGGKFQLIGCKPALLGSFGNQYLASQLIALAHLATGKEKGVVIGG